jgi:hypothetical protein
VRRVLARREGDIRRRSRKPLALRRAQSGEDRDGSYLVRCHHDRDPRGLMIGAAPRPVACKAATAGAGSNPPGDRTGRRYSIVAAPRTSSAINRAGWATAGLRSGLGVDVVDPGHLLGIGLDLG